MKKLNLVTSWPLILIALFLGILPSCKKDGINTQHSFSSPENYPISIGEAKAFFEQLKYSTDQQSLGNDSTRIFNLPVVPNWNEAHLGNSTSGRQIVIAPLQDSVFAATNDGRTGLRLLVSDLGGDTLNVEILLFIADSSYFFSNNQDIGFANFSGVYALFDIGFHFKGGVRMVNGAPVGGVTSIQRGGQMLMAEERGDGDCFDVIEIIYEPCPYITVEDCEVPVVVVTQDCVHELGGGGTGGGGGSGSGTGTGGGGGSGTGSPWTNTNWQYIFTSNIPVQIFVQGGGSLPAGLSIEEAEKLRQLNNICQFNAAQLDWLANNPYMIQLFLDYLNANPNQESVIANLKNLIDTAGQIPPPPNNDPVSVANPICADIMGFKTFSNGVNNFPAAGMFLRDSYFRFNRSGADPITVSFGYIRIEAYSGSSNGNCLNSCPTALTNAINSAVSQVQQWIDLAPPGASNQAISNAAKLNLHSAILQNFEINIQNCNPNYSVDVQNASTISNHNNFPIIDLDDEIPNCN